MYHKYKNGNQKSVFMLVAALCIFITVKNYNAENQPVIAKQLKSIKHSGNRRHALLTPIKK